MNVRSATPRFDVLWKRMLRKHASIWKNVGKWRDVPSGKNCYSLLLKMAIEIVDLPIKHGGSFHSYVNVYQRVNQETDKTRVIPAHPIHPEIRTWGLGQQTRLMGMITTTHHWMVMSWWSFFMFFPFLNSFSRNTSKMTFAAYRTPPL